MAKPFLKWVGGKGKQLRKLEPLLPKNVEDMRHVEPFVGGGAMFFWREPAKALLCDANFDLLNAYVEIRNDVDLVIERLKPLAAEHDSGLYYARRDRFNANEDDAPTRAALFVYLNKTSYNGLWRVNSKGRFNTPIGDYEAPVILDEPTLRAASSALQGASLSAAHFRHLLFAASAGDFIYFDPPYDGTYNSYSNDWDGDASQEQLQDLFVQLDSRGCKLMLTNADTPAMRYLYGEFRIDTISAGRSVNSDGAGRGPVSEIVVRNY